MLKEVRNKKLSDWHDMKIYNKKLFHKPLKQALN